MKKISILSLCLVTLSLAIPSQAQLVFKSKPVIGSQIVENSLSSGIVLLDRSYQLFDTVRHIAMGRDESESYGHSLSLAVVTADSSLLVTESFLEPWRFDTSYHPLDNYTPTLFEANVRQVSDTSFSRFTYDTCEKFGKDGLFEVPYKAQGLAVDSLIGKKIGFFAVFSSTVPLAANTKSPLNCTLVEYELNVEWGQTIYDIGAKIPKFNVVGGLYVVPVYEKPGVLTLQVAGMMKIIDGKWKLLTFNH